MRERIFADTNILIYHFTKDVVKYEVTNAIISNPLFELVTSTKVLSEFSNVCLRKGFVKNKSHLTAHIDEISRLFDIVGLSKDDLVHAIDIHVSHKISYYDSIIVANALHSDCQKLYTEDLHHGLKIGKKQMRIINPFRQ